jgi:transposase-like protein
MARRTHEESIKYWGRIIREHEASGLTIKQFCGDRGIQQTQFYKWRKQLGAKDSGAQPAAPLIPVTVAGPRRQDTSRIEVRIDESVSVFVAAGFDARTLGEVVAALCHRGSRKTSMC